MHASNYIAEHAGGYNDQPVYGILLLRGKHQLDMGDGVVGNTVISDTG